MRHTREEVAFRGVCLLRGGKRGCEDILLPLLLFINVGYVAFGEEYFFCLPVDIRKSEFLSALRAVFLYGGVIYRICRRFTKLAADIIQ